MSLLNTFYAVRNEQFRYRVMAAMALVSQQIVNDESIPEYELPKVMANAILREPENEGVARPFLWHVITNQTINNSVTSEAEVTASDEDIIWVVTDAWRRVYPLSTEAGTHG